MIQSWSFIIQEKSSRIMAELRMVSRPALVASCNDLQMTDHVIRGHSNDARLSFRDSVTYYPNSEPYIYTNTTK
ncbi:hypothetical protein RclHR1_00200018 [Rhizophagus clarus]|uniref:Uncharacterized protein n=1 Tax=Rhizophagus clarus TaxID=94130 RepID=A0A2Z6QSM6_9GLOM|nr:hypothetical protein RclHR1_00200018 [Rhizophagus clarus]